MTSRPTETTVVTRQTFITALRREIPQAVLSLDDGNIALADLLEATIEAGVAVMSRYRSVSDRPGSPMTITAARAVSTAVLWEAVARPLDAPEYEVGRHEIGRMVSWYLGSSPDWEFESELLTSILPKLVEASFLVRLSSWSARPWGTPWAGHAEVAAAADAVTEIGLSRGACFGYCPEYTVTLHRSGLAAFIGGYNVDMIGPHEAGLESEAFDDLARAVMFLCLASPTRDPEPGGWVVTDRSSTSVWVARGAEQVDVGAFAGVRDRIRERLGAVIDLAASEFEWHAPGGQADAFVGPSPMPSAPGDRRHWTQARHDRYAGMMTREEFEASRRPHNEPEEEFGTLGASDVTQEEFDASPPPDIEPEEEFGTLGASDVMREVRRWHDEAITAEAELATLIDRCLLETGDGPALDSARLVLAEPPAPLGTTPLAVAPYWRVRAERAAGAAAALRGQVPPPTT